MVRRYAKAVPTLCCSNLSGCFARAGRLFGVRGFAVPMQFTGNVGLALAAAQNHVRQFILLGVVNCRTTNLSSLMERRNRLGFTFPVMLAIQC